MGADARRFVNAPISGGYGRKARDSPREAWARRPEKFICRRSGLVAFSGLGARCVSSLVADHFSVPVIGFGPRLLWKTCLVQPKLPFGGLSGMCALHLDIYWLKSFCAGMERLAKGPKSIGAQGDMAKGNRIMKKAAGREPAPVGKQFAVGRRAGSTAARYSGNWGPRSTKTEID